MTLKQFLVKLNKLAEDNPEALEMVVITANDNEGNWFSEVVYDPSFGFFSENDYSDDLMLSESFNAVCLN